MKVGEGYKMRGAKPPLRFERYSATVDSVFGMKKIVEREAISLHRVQKPAIWGTGKIMALKART